MVGAAKSDGHISFRRVMQLLTPALGQKEQS